MLPLDGAVFNPMLGHPGISALEYAYASTHAEQKKEKKSDSFFKRAFTGSAAASIISGHEVHGLQVTNTEPTEPESLLQRRRGTFINHTPRNHEAPSPKKAESHHTLLENHCRPYTSYHGSSDESTDASYNQADHHSSFDSFHGGRNHIMNANAPAELDSKEVRRASDDFPKGMRMLPYGAFATNPQANAVSGLRGGACRLSTASSKTREEQARDRKLRDLNTLKMEKKKHSQEEVKDNEEQSSNLERTRAFATSPPEAPTSTTGADNLKEDPKQRRRQTPYKVPRPMLADSPRHSPLEPLVAQHRRDITGSNVDPLPPHVDIDDIGTTAAFIAINEYFDSQERSSTVEQGADDAGDQSPMEPTPTFLVVADGLEVPNEHSSQSDFASTAEGHYSPYDRQNDTLEQRPPLPASQIRTVSPLPSRIAPPILGHEELTTRAKLNHFNHFMRNTGPPPEPRKTSKNWTLAIHKARSKVTVASGQTSPEKPLPIPACTKEMRTISGKKHLQIVIPQDQENMEARVERLDFLVKEMSEELAVVAGLNASDGKMSPEDVLEAYRVYKDTVG